MLLYYMLRRELIIGLALIDLDLYFTLETPEKQQYQISKQGQGQ
jgi:hypothetical protein